MYIFDFYDRILMASSEIVFSLRNNVIYRVFLRFLTVLGLSRSLKRVRKSRGNVLAEAFLPTN